MSHHRCLACGAASPETVAECPACPAELLALYGVNRTARPDELAGLPVATFDIDLGKLETIELKPEPFVIRTPWIRLGVAGFGRVRRVLLSGKEVP